MTRKTKIVCTLGPSTDKDDVLRNMMLNGMNVARFNFSHGNHKEQLARYEKFKQLREELNLPIAALLDTKGPEIRLRDFKDGKVNLVAGQKFTLTPRELIGSESISSITYKNLYADVSVGTRILLDDGRIEMSVDEISDEDIICHVINGGPISNHKGVNVPGVHLSMPFVSPADYDDILFGIENCFDFIAASFTRSAADILAIRDILENKKCDSIKIIAKIENRFGVDNIEEILTVSDGIMIARGDMGVEIDFTEVPAIQKSLIRHCYTTGRPAITATQMLESMITNPRPTRAEVTDVANAIYDGTSAIMLSGETAAGDYPVEAVRTMAAIAVSTEADIPYNLQFKRREVWEERLTVTAAVAHATCTTAIDTRAQAILTVTKSGETARLLCKYRPATPIVACVMKEKTCRQLALSWGITPILMPFAHNTDEMISMAVEAALGAKLVKNGDLVVITAGLPVGVPGTTNLIKAHLVGESIISGVGIGRRNASGVVCTGRTTEELQAKFHPGDVIVVPQTNNDMLSNMRDASAIITETSGMNSHAAIVGLALHKPVIIGAVGATEKLKDGEKVVVDAERGIVQAMPK